MRSSLLPGALLLLVGASFLTGGCSSKAPQGLDAAGYAQAIKQDIHDYVTAVRGNPKQARVDGALLVEKLEVYESQPVGDHGPTYAKLLAKTRELAQKDRSSSEVNRLLDELRQLANQLPGEVKKSPPPD
ncbi:MAG: hypothetical protein L0Z62_33650 [Gemmataceae bacterium]|nr:hypothetical protein [Gemmataceae bacterium]